jgi:hypothetical protein
MSDFQELASRVLQDGRVPDLETWTKKRISELGVEHGDDFELLEGKDLLVPELPEGAQRFLDKEFPREFSLGDASYELHYDLKRHEVTLKKVRGIRREPPDLRFLPSFRGMRIRLEDRGRVVVLRERK